MKLVYVVILSLFATKAVCQKWLKVHPEVYLGMNNPKGKEFSNVQGSGPALGFNLFLTVKEKFSIGPAYTLIYHQKNFNEGAKEVTGGSFFGVMADYSIPLFKNKIKFYPQVGFYKVGLSDFVGGRKNYGGDDIQILIAKGNALAAGVGAEYFRIRFSLIYRYAVLPITFDDALFAKLRPYNQYYTIFVEGQPDKMDFSSLTLQLGFRF